MKEANSGVAEAFQALKAAFSSSGLSPHRSAKVRGANLQSYACFPCDRETALIVILWYLYTG